MYREAPGPSHLLVSAVNGHVIAHDKASGRRVWEVRLTELPWRCIARIVIVHGLVIGFSTASRDVGIWSTDQHGVLFAIDYATGVLQWSVDVAGPIFSPTLFVEAPLVFVANGAALHAFSFDGGRHLWTDGAVGEVFSFRSTPQAHGIALASPDGSAPADGF